MGHGAMIRLAWVQRWTDKRTGGRYFYFRKPGMKRVRLPNAPGSAEFMAAYQAALQGERHEIASKRTKPGSISAVTTAYFNSISFHSLAPSTKKAYRGIAERFRQEHGDKSAATLTAVDVRRMVNNRANKPGAARNFLKVLRAIMASAVELGTRDDNPCDGIKIKAPRVAGEGFREWTEDHIRQFEARHAVGTRARLAFALVLHTAQRGRSDVTRMGRQHERDGVLFVKQQKTGARLRIPIGAELRKILDATPNNNLTYITTDQGKPFTPAGFGNWFREVCDEAGLRGYSAHGLRKSQCRRLADAGASAHEIMAISGHKTLKEVERYTRGADQERLAVTAMQKVESGRK
jgi:integrase